LAIKLTNKSETKKAESCASHSLLPQPFQLKP
jgi:hypothetical protein